MNEVRLCAGGGITSSMSGAEGISRAGSNAEEQGVRRGGGGGLGGGGRDGKVRGRQHDGVGGRR